MRESTIPHTAIAALLIGSALAVGCQTDSAPRCVGCDVVLVLIDTLRADHLPCYGYARDTAPVICGLAQRSILFEDVTATSSWTKPSTASILSGLYAKRHGALSEAERLPDDVTILPEILKQRGYRTQAFSGNGSVGPQWNFDQGYDDFVQFDDPPEHIGSATINARALPFLHSLDSAQPLFLFVHYVDPHDPYTPGAAVRVFSKGHRKPTRHRFESFRLHFHGQRKQLQTQVDYYDDEILQNDRSVGDLLAELERVGRRERSVVVITSDHGEEFFEHGLLTHRKQLFEESLRVPLIISVPGMTRAIRVATPISLVDVLPTLLPIIGIDAPADIDGRNALAPSPQRSLYAEFRDFGRELYAVREGSEKAIVQVSQPPSAVVYALAQDPGEKHPQQDRDGLSARLLAWATTGRRTGEATEISPEQRAILEKLGYLKPEAPAR